MVADEWNVKVVTSRLCVCVCVCVCVMPAFAVGSLVSVLRLLPVSLL